MKLKLTQKLIKKLNDLINEIIQLKYVNILLLLIIDFN